MRTSGACSGKLKKRFDETSKLDMGQERET
jgi:hypothetical protein